MHQASFSRRLPKARTRTSKTSRMIIGLDIWRVKESVMSTGGKFFLICLLCGSSKTLRFAKSIYTRNQPCLNMLILTYVPHFEGLISLPPPAKSAACTSWLCALLVKPHTPHTALVPIVLLLCFGFQVPGLGTEKMNHFF